MRDTKWKSNELALNLRPSDRFTGPVRIDPLFQAPDSALVRRERNLRAPHRTAWHTHPLGQVLVVTAGCGRTQRREGPIEQIRPGGLVCFSPGEKYWHEATRTTAVTISRFRKRKTASSLTGWNM